MPGLGLLVDIVLIAVSALAVGHAVLYKRDPRAAWGWIVTCVAFPGVGGLVYFLFGVNRIQTQARRLGRRMSSVADRKRHAAVQAALPVEVAALVRVSDAVTRRPLVDGNRVQPLHNGEEAFPAMWEAIAGARRSVYLSTYIFESNATGLRFMDCLAEAVRRGADVKVLVDAVGERYSRPRATALLRARGVPAARFLPLSLRNPAIHLNLRNHRKLLVVDGSVGFTGGMNIGDRHLAGRLDNPDRVVDLQFRVTGPVVPQMEAAFLEDWSFVSGKACFSDLVPNPTGTGPAVCRGVSAGPNEDFEKLTWILIGALNAARERVLIMTPYFIPSRELIATLNAAALRGVKIELLLPGQNNLPFVDWASRAYLWELLKRDIWIGFQPPPFVHTKLFLVDEQYALVGSANLDPRSLRLNFEFNLEIYDRGLVAELAHHFDAAKAVSRRYTWWDDQNRPLAIKLRDGVARLLSPYL
ncbi:MAG: cardiolipin synthase [Planctomycetota bacterium]|nr:MAG: cardiolipin synthase [Planctomycetota bacterium]